MLARKYTEWIAVFLFVGVLLVYTVWHLQSFPQYIPVFSVGLLVLILLVTLVGLRPKYKEWIRRLVMKFHGRGLKSGGWFYGHRRHVFLLLVLVGVLMPILGSSKLVPAQYFPAIGVAGFLIILASGVVLVAGFLRAVGKWGLMFILILTLLTILRIWT